MTLPIEHDRLTQLLMKCDPTLGWDAARIQLERATLVLSADTAMATPWGQAALLTIAECATRSFRGGVYLQGEFDHPVIVGNWMPVPIRRMLVAAGCKTEAPPDDAVHLHVGTSGPTAKGKVFCWADGWVATVGPTPPDGACASGNELSGACAGAMGVTELFRLAVLGDLVAGKRTQRLSPLTPGRAERHGLDMSLLPAGLWLLGLGNLGQAVLWVLGLLPYADPAAVQLVLQDTDKSGPENEDIQILTKPGWVRLRKTRMTAAWAEARGFQTTLIETPFSALTVRDPSLPGLALVGVDNIETRRLAARPEAGFDLVLDAGLGATPTEIFDIRVHGFPGSRTPLQAWPEIQREEAEIELVPGLATLIAQGRLDRCGALSISGQAVGVPGTAVAAATIQIAQACRAIRERQICDFVDTSLTNPGRTTVNETPFARARVLLFEEGRATR